MIKIRSAASILSVSLCFLLLFACKQKLDQSILNYPESTQAITPSLGQTNEDLRNETPTPTLLSKSREDAPLSLVETISFFDKNGVFYVTGLVRNQSEQTLVNIQVSIQVQDSQRETLAQVTVPLSTDPLFPGEHTVFVQNFKEITTPTPLITSNIVAFTVANSGRADLVIQNVGFVQTEDSTIQITGEILNTLQEPVYIDTITAAFFNQGNNLTLASRWLLGPRYLEPGEKGPFRIPIAISGTQIQPSDTYEIYYQASKGQLARPLPLSFDSEPEYFIDSEGIFHLLAQISNDSQVIVQPHFLASIYDPQGNLIDASHSSLFGLPLLPSETLPVEFTDWGILNNGSLNLDHTWKYAIQWEPQLNQTPESKWITLETQLESISTESGSTQVKGIISNPANDTVKQYYVIARFWDLSNGDTLALVTTRGDFLLSGEQSMPFKITTQIPIDLEDLNLGVDLVAMGELATMER